ncbi:hypothetical protein QBC34DRAFT_402918 [Podospora aff. communis PSN243]|uniref:Cell division cycle protein 123 n=1 Tax=Podospora aff. communis PSN243 TaxID=3040156 RepID=A0AAV9GQF5_9PEZI|nr:hypothetical protein QBC34DRAFT_402918 [Podospora aff. communis PSN243]
MDLHIINHHAVQADYESGTTTNFNSNFHTIQEAPDLPIPSNAPTTFERWLPLIMRSRGLPKDALQVTSLTRAQVRVILDAASASVHTRRLNQAYAEDLYEEARPAFASLTFPPSGLFMRLSACSTKDGENTAAGKISVSSPDEILLQLTTSLRAWKALSSSLNAGHQEIKVFFLPFDERIRTEYEYRVFCMPGSLRITAVSQYRWHAPWVFAECEEGEKREMAEVVMRGVEEIHRSILAGLGDDEDGLDGLLRRQGFTFDVFFDRGRQACELIELNTFGVRSACGSCLFHWLRDQDLLYGKRDVVEFRVVQ